MHDETATVMTRGLERSNHVSSAPDDESAPRPLLDGRQNSTRYRAIADHMMGAFGRMGASVILINRTGKVLLMNDLGQRLLLDGVMNMSDGRLIASDLSSDTRLQAAIRSATRDDGPLNQPSCTTIFSMGQPDRGELFVRISPLLRNGEESLAILVAVDPRAGMGPGADVLQRLFDLTPAEARVAQLLATGLDVAAIAEGRGTSVGTVKHQLRSICMKIGVSRQSEAIVILRRCMVLSTLG